MTNSVNGLTIKTVSTSEGCSTTMTDWAIAFAEPASQQSIAAGSPAELPLNEGELPKAK